MPYLIFTSKSKRRVTDADAEGDLSVVCALMSERTVSQSPHTQPLGTAVFMCRISCICFHRSTPFRSASHNCSSVGWFIWSSLCMCFFLTGPVRQCQPPTRFLEILFISWVNDALGSRLRAVLPIFTSPVRALWFPMALQMNRPEALRTCFRSVRYAGQRQTCLA